MIDRLLTAALELTERGWIPDSMVRAGIRHLCRQRLRDEARGGPHEQAAAYRRLLSSMHDAPIAPLPEKANEQHYEAPVELFDRALGPHLKYSCCHWDDATTLPDAEASALRLTCARADLADGQDVLELGCGWGSLSLWMAAHYPASRILAVSNSRLQRAFIERRAEQRGLSNLEVVTADMNDFSTDRRFDRIVSVEMFEHMRNYTRLLERIASWMRPEAKLFVHVFCHRRFAYPFQTEDADDWMGKYFFTGGIMPNESLLLNFQDDLKVTKQWRWSGSHYARTANAWLENLDAARDELMPVFRRTYGAADSSRWFQRWRIFFMACAELWDVDGGREWFVAHYRFEPRAASSSSEAA